MEVVGGIIDGTGAVALRDFVDRFNPQFKIGAMDGNTTTAFGQWGPRRLLVPQLFILDKSGVIQAQYMGADEIFEGDKVAHLRAAINKVMGGSKPAAPVVKKK